MNQVTVHRAVLSDVEAIVPAFDRYRQFYGQSSDLVAARQFLLHRYNLHESVLFVAHDGDVPVGFAQLYPSFSSVALARSFILNDLFVEPAWRRKGIASMLLTASVNFGRSVGAIRLTLSTARKNDAAQMLYESAGWKRDQEFYVYHLVMHVALPA